MTPEQRLRVRDLFEQALEADPADLAEWLAAAAPDDSAVRREVASLIAHDRRAGSFLAEPALGSAAGAVEPLSPGAEVGAYAVVREIGRGGMGRVYLAEDRRLGRRVALKAIAPELARDAAHRERLRREARAMAALTHPSICAVYALEELDGNVFLVSEFIDGRTLREEIENGTRPSVDLAMRTAVDLASALASAHARGITHRDLKPGNVMHAADGRLKVLDFGLARLDESAPGSQGRHTITAPGATLGTPLYMAPEQLNGGVVDSRADIFAFGVLMYEYATGTHPFEAATPTATLARILEAEPLPVESRRPDLPPSLVAAIARCLKKQAADRFQSAGDIVAALTRPAEVPRAAPSAWWRVHQAAMIVAYFVACADAWQLKEQFPSLALTWAFVSLGVLAAIGGVLRGHLLFIERVTPGRLALERRRTRRGEAGVDVLLAFVLFGTGLFVATLRPVASVLTMALAIGIAAAAILIEPSTSAAAFPPAQD